MGDLHSRFDVLVTLDFETFFDSGYTLRKLTTEAYVRDPRFEVIGVGVKWGDQPSVWLEEWDFREWARRVDWSRVALCCHHSQFDGLVLSYHYGIVPGLHLCTMSMGRAHHGPMGVGLDLLAKKYDLGEKGTELANAKGKHRDDFTEEEWQALGVYCRNDVDLTARLLPRMPLPTPELWLVDTTIRAFTEPTLIGRLDVLRKALADERAKKADLLARVGASKDVLSSSEKFAALLKTLGEEPPMKPGKRGYIYAFAKTDPGMQSLLEHPNEAIRFLAEARLSVKSTIVETRTERMIGVASRGPVPIYLKYCGAHTHRWSGGDKMNPQNFNRGGILRDALEAPDGHVLVVADSGQIEARKVAWVAGQKDLLETFRRNDGTADGDFYSDEGSNYFGRKLSKKETPVERQVSKSMVLGLGFGMGWLKFSGELLKGMLGAPPVQFTEADADRFGVDVDAFANRPYDGATCGDAVANMTTRIPLDQRLIHCAVTDYFVRRYREKNDRIAQLWKAMGHGLERMETGRPWRFGCLRFVRHGIVKPSGLTLHYPGLKRSGDQYSYVEGREHKKAYGGLITENVVQSLARDIVAEQALRVRAAGYRIATTTHDEIVAVVPEDQGEKCLAFMLRTMKTPPTWCRDLPLNATGGIAKSYGEAK